MTIEAVKARRVRRRAEARVSLDQSGDTEHARLDAEYTAALQSSSIASGQHEAAQALLTFEEAREANDMVLVFESIGHGAWTDLLAAHPPTKEQLKANKGLDHNPETFPIAAVVASCVETRNPDAAELDAETATYLFVELEEAEWLKIWVACLDANLGAAERPKSLAASVARALNAKSSTTAASAGSPGASS